MLSQAQQQLVACHQQAGAAACRQDQEFLVVDIAAARQDVGFPVLARQAFSQVQVAFEQRPLRGSVEAEFGVGEDALKLDDAVGIGQGLHSAGGERGQQGCGRRVGEVQHVHDDVGVEHKARAKRRNRFVFLHRSVVVARGGA